MLCIHHFITAQPLFKASCQAELFSKFYAWATNISKLYKYNVRPFYELSYFSNDAHVFVLTVGLLEQPVIIESGKREKKKVERLSMTEAYNTTNQPKEIDIPEGVGEKLGDIPRGNYCDNGDWSCGKNFDYL